MRKLIVVLMLVVAALFSAFTAPKAEAQTTFPSVTGLTPFSPEANYMSLPGYLRYRHLLASGRWITREEAERAVADAGAPTGPAATG